MIDTLVTYFSFPFVRYAFIVGVLISLCSSLLGVTLVLKRFSFIVSGSEGGLLRFQVFVCGVDNNRSIAAIGTPAAGISGKSFPEIHFSYRSLGQVVVCQVAFIRLDAHKIEDHGQGSHFTSGGKIGMLADGLQGVYVPDGRGAGGNSFGQLSARVKNIVTVSDFLFSRQKGTGMSLCVAAGVVPVSPDCKPTLYHMAFFVKVVAAAADFAEACTHGTGTGSRGGIKEISIFAGVYKTGENLSFSFDSLCIAGKPFFASHCKEADLHVSV